MLMTRGYFGIGIENQKTPANLGTLWRSAFNFGASFLFTVNRRYPPQVSDTVKAWRHVPLQNYGDIDAFAGAVPMDCEVIGVELHDHATPLKRFHHPERAIYLLGAEDKGLSAKALGLCQRVIQIESRQCLNVAVAGSIVMWHRNQQREVAL
jgi:tRNA G18 (ribose-2'-O)-methylase SpoU